MTFLQWYYASRVGKYLTRTTTRTNNAGIFSNLTALQQSVYILEKLRNGESKEQIVACCSSDEQIVTIWIDFITAMNWLIKNKSPSILSDTYLITEAGEKVIKKYSVSTN